MISKGSPSPESLWFLDGQEQFQVNCETDELFFTRVNKTVW